MCSLALRDTLPVVWFDFLSSEEKSVLIHFLGVNLILQTLAWFFPQCKGPIASYCAREVASDIVFSPQSGGGLFLSLILRSGRVS